MTIIKSLTARGFKSFAKKTEFLFGNNFNIILGANGTGKSNVADSICFVLGKSSAKGLRAEKSANLIYNGGKSKSPAKDAEVSIVFDNSKKEFPINSKEVKITRIVKQSGQSIYKINDEVRTRQQVVEVLSTARIDPNGHNIILQGDITRFMDMKPVERREIIEEVSGISVYEDKKQKSLNELERVEKKLNEAKIILTEREAYLKELKKDRDQALKYKELENNIKRNKATYLSLQIKEKESKKVEIENRIKKQKDEILKVEKSIDLLNKEIEDNKNKIKKFNEEIEKKGEKEQLKLNKEIEEIKETIIRDESRVEVCKNELRKINERNSQLKKDKTSIDEEIKRLNLEKDNLEKKKRRLLFECKQKSEQLGKLKSKAGISDIGSRMEDIDKKIDENQSKIILLQDEKQSSMNEKNRLNLELDMVEEKINSLVNLKREDAEKLKNLKDMKQEFKKILSEINKAMNNDSMLSSQLSNARKKLNDVNENLAKLNIRKVSAKERVLGNIAIKKVLEIKKGVYGTVSDLGNVNSKYSLALEVAAGSRINSVVVDDDKVAAKCIKYLKDNRLGVVTFLPLNKIRSSKAGLNVSGKGIHGLAVDLISFEPKFRNIFNYVFGNTIVVDSIDTARRLGIGKQRMVTLDGDLMEQSGAMIGGFRRRTFGSFNEKEINKDISLLGNESSRLKEIIMNLENKKIRNEEDLIKLKERKAILEVKIKNYEEKTSSFDISELKEKKKKLKSLLSELDKKLSKKNSEFESLNKAITNLRKQREIIREKTQNKKFMNELSRLEEENQRLKEEVSKVDLEIKNYDVQINTIHIPEKNKIVSILKNNEKEKENFSNELSALINKLKKDKKTLKKKEVSERRFYKDFKSLFAKRNLINEYINKKENLVLRNEDKIKYLQDKLNNYTIEKARVTAEIEGLNKEFEEFVGVQLRRGIPMSELSYEIKKFESLMKNMGNVNLRALEIYERVNEEYQKILGKTEKLKMEKDDVMALIREIDNKKHKIFMKTFNVIHSNFKKIFASLSTKGEAHLDLEDRENVFNGGIDIKVKLTGNRFFDTKSLSGGEKTLTALAFIFAIQEYSPSSFYLFDEVDAALDKTNSVLLSRLIQKYAQSSQYIVISHNDHIISEADRIYGVSMQDGITKVVSLKI
jgi:chromosome segregation protein